MIEDFSARNGHQGSTSVLSSYILLCTTTREYQLSSSSTISVQWLGPDGLEISGRSFSITGSEGPTYDVIVTSRLIFNSLLTSHWHLSTEVVKKENLSSFHAYYK